MESEAEDCLIPGEHCSSSTDGFEISRRAAHQGLCGNRP